MNKKKIIVNKLFYILSFLLLLNACNTTNNNTTEEQKTIAQKFMKGVYGCDPSVVDELAADSILITYPIFVNIFGSPAIRGRDSVKNFVNHFCSKWKDPQFTFHETIAQENKVVIVWGFKARNVSSNKVQSWGGITLFRFNDDGKITAEIGEESSPGPIERLNTQN